MAKKPTKPGLMRLKTRVTSRISLVKIDRIREDRLSRDMIYRENKRQKVSDTFMVKNDNKQEDDLISRLPEDTLHSIISRLSMKEAIRTSILSRTWKHLWRKSLKKLDFDAVLDMRYLSKYAFVRCVDELFRVHCGTIESFRMINRYLPAEIHTERIDKWIEFAMEKKVQKIELNLSREIHFSVDKKIRNINTALWLEKPDKWKYEKFYLFPEWLFTDQGEECTLKHLSLTYCLLDPPSDSKPFNSLTSLTLKESSVSEENVVNILSCCSSLEWFSMENCCCSSRLTFTSGISHSSLMLKHLNIHHCRFLDEIDIREAENLTSFEYGGAMIDTQFLRIKSNRETVKRLSFCISWDSLEGIHYVSNGIASDFPQIESLILTLPPIVEIPANIPSFTHLKQLVLILLLEHPESLWELTYTVLKASPLLHKLELHFPTCEGADRQIEDISPEDFRHDNLREVALYNFGGQAREVELLMHLTNCALAIENVQITRTVFSYEGDGEWCNLHYRSSKIKRIQVFEMLRKRLPTAINLQVS